MITLARFYFLIVLACGVFPLAKAASSADGKTAADYIVSVHPDRPDAVYQQGESVSFEIGLLHLQAPAPSRQVEWTISKDGAPPVRNGVVTLDEKGRGIVSGKLDEPGFLQCKVVFKDDTKSYVAFAGAAIDPTHIGPSMPRPADFDAFWDAQLKRLAAIPINSRLTPVPAPAGQAGIECFDLQADCIGAPVSGYYSRPLDARPGSHPARLCVDGAGVRSTDLVASAHWAGRGVLSLAINAHGIPNGQPREFYAELEKGALKNYRIEGRESRDPYYFLGMFLRVKRALDFLASQPEWDGRILMIEGGSQGGAQAMAGAALDPRVTFYTALVPAMCDHTGMAAGRIAGWPKLVPVRNGAPDPAALATSRYFDMVNFAPRIEARGYFWAGFFDVTCPPTTVYAAYNQLSAPKEMIHAVNHGHNLDGANSWQAISAALQNHIDEMRARPAPSL